ncbi:MAG: response regulator transcription factor [Ornithinimicrobium sp.]|uniref:response regulator n=1 Tax=Ornithinimicrobium sp. TaxID=1977084 RepID=UPI0026E047F5|nr:response regulator transcription factor [Ornithinimicrobium sp.]MDO5740230.1 response regulator transcription factor [Ornithinimicrobium sp.]
MAEISTEPAVRVLLVDDDPMVCSGLRMILDRGSGGRVEVVGAVGDGAEAVGAVQRHHPDVVLMDVRMPRMDGITATRMVRDLPSPPEVVVLTTFDSDDEPFRAAAAGANGFLLKTESPEDLVAHVIAVAAGEGAVSKRTAKQFMQHVRLDRSSRWRAARAAVGTLTPRQREVAGHVAAGLSNVEIAQRLYVSPSTVKTQLASIQSKLDVTNRVMIAVMVTQAAAN